MRCIFIVLLMLSACPIYSQDTLFYNGNEPVENKEHCTYFEVNTTGEKKGYFTITSYYKNGRKRSVSPYFVDEKGFRIPEGKKSQWFDNGKKQQIVNYKNGQLHGKVRSYYAKGKLKRRDLYKNGALVKGQCRDENGQKIAHRPYFVSASYEGGDAKRQRYFMDNLNYPAAARENEIQGRVMLNFMIEKDGSIRSVKVVKTVDAALDAEAKRVVMKMPKWQPATEDDEPVRSYFSLPVNFNLQ